jgi:hypothetical protein
VTLKGRVAGGDRLVATSDGMTTYARRCDRSDAGTTGDLADVTRLCDALDEIDTLWPSRTSDAPADVFRCHQATWPCALKHVQDEFAP